MGDLKKTILHIRQKMQQKMVSHSFFFRFQYCATDQELFEIATRIWYVSKKMKINKQTKKQLKACVILCPEATSYHFYQVLFDKK